LKFTPLHIEGLVLVEPKIFGDHRGYFYESYNANEFAKNDIPTNFVQDNQSLSNKGTLRGLHFQRPPFDQGKMVRVVQGSVLDVVVDIRTNSATYGQHLAVELTAQNHYMLWVPPGFAHGFCTLEDDTIFSYKCTNFYNVESEMGLAYNDASLQIKWPDIPSILSQRDRSHPSFQDFKSPF
jgi:dTDP-4-dehydrorhamnose 3,5-epimerase